MKPIIFIFLLTAVFFQGYAQTITERIEYTVTIRSQEASDADWFTNNIEAGGRMPWLKSLLKDVRAGKIKAFDPLSEDFSKPLTLTEIDRIIVSTDTVSTLSPDPPYDPIETVTKRELDPSEIDRVKFRERWSYDAKKGLKKEVVAFAPMQRAYINGEYIGDRILFWVK